MFSKDVVGSLLVTGSHFNGPLVEFFTNLFLVSPVLSVGEGPVIHAVFAHGSVSRFFVGHVALNFLVVLLKNDRLIEMLV